MDEVVEKVDGGWRIPLEGFVAASVGGTGNTILRLEAGDAHAEVLVSVNMVPRIVALAAERARVKTATASDDSTLRVVFEDGEVLEIPAGDYEEWEIRGPGSIVVVAPAGGGEPAIWDATSPMITFRGEDYPQVLHDILDSKETQEGEGA